MQMRKISLYIFLWGFLAAASIAGCSDEDGDNDVGVQDDVSVGDDTSSADDVDEGDDILAGDTDVVEGCNPHGEPLGGGTGSETNPYLLCSPDHLVAMSEGSENVELWSHFLVTEDIDMSGVDDFRPIADNNPDRFSGHFDGGGHTISNLTAGDEEADYAGLIGYLDPTGEVVDVYLESVDITGHSHVGGLVGFSRGSVSGSSTTGQVVGTRWHTGGLVGNNNGEIRDSFSSADVQGTARVGGLVGTHDGDGTLENCHSSGEVYSSGSMVGGLVGQNFGLVSDSHSTSSIDVESSTVGGLVGENLGEIHGSHSSGSINGDGTVGGLVGDNDGEISDSFATGNVEAESSQGGGLVGLNQADASVVRSFSAGDVLGPSVGGLVALNYGLISESYATGATSGSASLSSEGGLVADNSGVIQDCYATGHVGGGSDDLGGLVSRNWVDQGAEVTSSYWDQNSTTLEDSAAGTPLSTSDFDDEDSFQGWNFDTTWVIGEAPDGETRPVFQWQDEN